MSRQDVLDRVAATVSAAALDDARWPAASALIDDACRAEGNTLFYGYERSPDNIEIMVARICYRGERNEELERLYLEDYYRIDERIPRVRRLPESQVVRIRDLYTEPEQRTSPAYNEALPRGKYQNGLNARLDGPHATRVGWATADPVGGGDWSSAQFDMIKRILPHIRQYVSVRQALVDAEALGSSLAGLLDNERSCVIHLDRRGQIVEANEAALELLRKGDGICDRGGFLQAWLPADNANLQKLIGRALPRFGGQGASGSMVVTRQSVLPRLVFHISPVGGGQPEFSPLRIAALVLVVDPARRTRIALDLVAESLGLTPAEARVAVHLAEGKTVREIAAATGRSEMTIRWHLHHICNKNGISRQVELVQLVLSLAAIPQPQE